MAPEELGALPRVLWQYTNSPLASPTFVELSSSGQVSRLKNRNLQDALLRYEEDRVFYLEIMTEASTSFKPDSAFMRALELDSSKALPIDWNKANFAFKPWQERIFETKFHLYNLTEQKYFLGQMRTKTKAVLAELEAAN